MWTAPGGVRCAPCIIVFQTAFLRSFCRRRLSFPVLGSRSGGDPGVPWTLGPCTSGAIDVAEMSVAVSWGGRDTQSGQPSSLLRWEVCVSLGPGRTWGQGCGDLTVLLPEHPEPSRGVLSSTVPQGLWGDPTITLV